MHDGDTIVVPTGAGEPPALLTALSEARRDFRGVQVSQILPVRKFGYIDPDTLEHVRHTAHLFSGASRPCGLGRTDSAQTHRGGAAPPAAASLGGLKSVST